jgi:hypothetical protein
MVQRLDMRDIIIIPDKDGHARVDVSRMEIENLVSMIHSIPIAANFFLGIRFVSEDALIESEYSDHSNSVIMVNFQCNLLQRPVNSLGETKK